MSRTLLSLLSLQILGLYAILGLVHHFAADLSPILLRMDLPQALEPVLARASASADFLRRMFLIASTLLLCTGIAGLVRHQRRPMQDFVALAALILLGCFAVDAAASSAWAKATANLCLVALLAATAYLALVTGADKTRKLVFVSFLLVSTLPQLWRCAVLLEGPGGSRWETLLRQAADYGLLSSWASLALIRPLKKQGLRDGIAVTLAIAVTLFAIFEFDATRHLLSSTTALWYGSYPKFLMIILFGLGAFGLTRLVLDRSNRALGLSFLFFYLAGGRATEPLILMLEANACILLLHSCCGRGRDFVDLARKFA